MGRIAALLLTLFGTINSSFAQSATGDIGASIVSTMTITQPSQMNFGLFSSSTTAGTINTGGIADGGVTAINSSVARSDGIFSVSGTENASYIFTLPSQATIGLGGSISASPMIVDLSFPFGESSNRSLSSGNDIVTIKGVLNVPANQPSGNYSGTYTVTTSY